MTDPNIKGVRKVAICAKCNNKVWGVKNINGIMICEDCEKYAGRPNETCKGLIEENKQLKGDNQILTKELEKYIGIEVIKILLKQLKSK